MKLPELSFFSVFIRTVNDEATPPIVMVDAVCDRCAEGFEVRSPEDSQNLLNALVHHLKTCPKRPA